jgi:hypothetical protein
MMRCVLIFAILLLSTRLLAAEAVEYAQFADDIVATPASELPRNAVGFMDVQLSSSGLIYKRRVASQTQAWVGGSYTGSSMPDMSRRYPGMASSLIYEKDQLLVLLGVDRTVYITENHRLGFILGGAIGYRQSRYEAKLYPGTCSGKICRFNPNDALETAGADRYGFAAARLGFGWFDRSVVGQKMDFVLSVVPELARWPNRLQLSVPGVANLDPANGNQNFMTFELTLRI